MNITWLKWALKKYAPDILTGMAVGGTFLTGWLGVKAGANATTIYENKTSVKEDITNKEIFECTWKCYIPPVAAAVVTSACVIGAHSAHLHNEAILAGVAVLYSSKYRKAEQKLRGLIGNNEVAKEAYEDDNDRPPWLPVPAEDECVYYEPYSKQYFTANAHTMTYAQLHINKIFQEYGGVTLNDYLNVLPGCTRYPDGKHIGWYQGTDVWEDIWGFYNDAGHFIDMSFEDQKDGSKYILYSVQPGPPDEDWEPFK